MIKDFKYGLTLSDKQNPVLYISYISKNGNSKKEFGNNAVRLCIGMFRSKQIDSTTLFNVKSLKKTTDEAFILNQKIGK